MQSSEDEATSRPRPFANVIYDSGMMADSEAASSADMKAERTKKATQL